MAISYLIRGGETLNDRVIIEVAESVNMDSLVTELLENPNVLVPELKGYPIV
ncbi:hypothetical protein [Acetobacterium sp.]|uniref:hypothetical protein n=1 Tax=Acetobacterium sp. TaxID=1872094 RepID=UPI002F42CBFE